MKRRRFAVAVALTAGLLSLAGAPGAGAATEIGNSCSAQGGVQDYTLLQLTQGAGGPPLTVQTPGVITQWKVNIGIPLPSPTFGQRLRVFRATGGSNQFTAVAESEIGNAGTGLNVFPTRIPVLAGDRIGASAQGEKQAAFYCYTNDPADTMGIFKGDVPVGSTQTFGELEKYRLALAAIVEPDADNDGYGDETQDKCPQSASTQVECPVIVLDSFPLAKKSSIVVLVAASESGSVTVSGSAKLPKASKASSSAKATLKKVKKNVTAGKIARFTLKFPGSLRSALKTLPRGKSIPVKLQASATNVAGQVSKDKAKLKLR